MDGLTQKSTYKLQVEVDLNKNNLYTDSIDYNNNNIEYKTDANPDFQASYMDSTTFDTARRIID